MKRKKILLVEDDEDILRNLIELLELEGYEVATALNGQEALKKLNQSYKPDLILLDIMMPVMNGIEFRKAQLAHEKFSKIPTIIMSADGQIDEKLKSTNALAAISKPSNILDMLRTIERDINAPL